MGETNINGQSYAHHHSELRFTPNGGARAGQGFTIRSFASFDYGRKRKSTHVAGTDTNPVAIARGMNKPEWSGEMSELEWQDLAGWDPSWGAHTWTITVTKQLPGGPVNVDTLLDATFDDDDFSSKDGNVQTRKIGGICRKILTNGVDPTEENLGAL